MADFQFPWLEIPLLAWSGLCAQGPFARPGTEFAYGHHAGGQRLGEPVDQAAPPRRRREVVDGLVVATKVARPVVAAVRGDLVESEIGAAHEILRALEAHAAEKFLGTGATSLHEKTAQVAHRGVDRLGNF